MIINIRCRPAVRISGFHPGDPGSIPGNGNCFCYFFEISLIFFSFFFLFFSFFFSFFFLFFFFILIKNGFDIQKRLTTLRKLDVYFKKS